MKKFAVIISLAMVLLPVLPMAQEFDVVKGGFRSCDVYQTGYYHGTTNVCCHFRIYHFEYDTAGREILYERFNEDGTEASKFYYVYDSLGRLIEFELYSNGEYSHTERYQYDKKGRLEKDSYCYEDMCRIDKHEYDLKGRLVKELSFDEVGKLGETTVWEYDRYDREVKETSTYYKEPHTFYYYYEYDESGLQKSIYSSYDNSEKIICYSLLFDKSGRVLEKKDYNSSGTEVSETTTYKYNEAGLETEMVSRGVNSASNYSFSKKYDAFGNMTENILYWDDGTVKEQDVYEYMK